MLTASITLTLDLVLAKPQVGGSISGHCQCGITTFGKLVVHEMHSLNMILDLAHASKALMSDILDMPPAQRTLIHDIL